MTDYRNEHCNCNELTSTNANVSVQYVDVSVPICLRPQADIGRITTTCCAEPVVVCNPCQCCEDGIGYEITITQTVCIKVPVKYSTKSSVGDTCIR